MRAGMWFDLSRICTCARSIALRRRSTPWTQTNLRSRRASLPTAARALAQWRSAPETVGCASPLGRLTCNQAQTRQCEHRVDTAACGASLQGTAGARHVCVSIHPFLSLSMDSQNQPAVRSSVLKNSAQRTKSGRLLAEARRGFTCWR
eukprot:SAG31_NODE_5355_length_2591_cov_2.022472_2_plen_148_part_00